MVGRDNFADFFTVERDFVLIFKVGELIYLVI